MKEMIESRTMNNIDRKKQLAYKTVFIHTFLTQIQKDVTFLALQWLYLLK